MSSVARQVLGVVFGGVFGALAISSTFDLRVYFVVSLVLVLFVVVPIRVRL